MQEYDNDRWRIISGKVGNGFSATACKDKAVELEGADTAPEVATAAAHAEPEPEQAS